MSIGNRIDEAYIKLVGDDLENSLVQLSIAIDATAKKKFDGEKKVGKRIRRFIMEYEDLIIHLSMAGMVRIITPDGVSYGEKEKLGDVIYKSIRCALLHEADISDKVVFRKGPTMGMDEEKFIVTDQLLWAFILIIIGDQTNLDQNLKKNHQMIFNGKSLHLNQLWGKLDEIKISTEYLSPSELGVVL